MKGLVLEDGNNTLKVQIVRQEACAHCRACIAGYMKQEVMELDARNLCDAQTGDWVELELQDNSFMKAVLVSYGIPFLCFMAGILLGYYVVAPFVPLPAGLVSFVFGFAGIMLAYAWIRSKNATWENGKYTPLAVRLTTEGDEEGMGAVGIQ